MVTPIEETYGNKIIKLLPQEKEGKYQFSGRFLATRCAIEKFGDSIIIACHVILQKRVQQKGGLDYLQVFEVDGQRLWFIDDVTHVTCLLPSDY